MDVRRCVWMCVDVCVCVCGFVDRPHRSDCTAGQMDREAGWCVTNGNIGFPPLARVMRVGRQQQHVEMCGGYVWMCRDVWGCVFMYMNMWGCVVICWDVWRCG